VNVPSKTFPTLLTATQHLFLTTACHWVKILVKHSHGFLNFCKNAACEQWKEEPTLAEITKFVINLKSTKCKWRLCDLWKNYRLCRSFQLITICFQMSTLKSLIFKEPGWTVSFVLLYQSSSRVKLNAMQLGVQTFFKLGPVLFCWGAWVDWFKLFVSIKLKTVV